MASISAPAYTPVFDWFPARLLQRNPRSATNPYAAVILNQPLTSLGPVQRIWRRAQFRVAADGGANQLHDVAETAGQDFKNLDVIIGDLDSLRADVQQYFETETAGHKTEIIHDTDQYSTDFTKAVKLVQDRHPGIDVVALGGLGGRVDQGVSQLHHLYLFGERRRDATSEKYRIGWSDETAPHGSTFLLTSDSLTFLLLPGLHRIHVRERLGDGGDGGNGEPAEDVFAKHVGILPMQGPSVITTSGLEWDITDWPTEFGGQMSTSNHVLPETEIVEVLTNRSVVFTIALKEEWQGK
ncbi:thiamine pyrophosphokinase [Sporothrix schenckii 1099-18]|uniref:Thiamine pyrophosphokinase n=2 Tax=Sporothrix schenckii TaxID=29908 RepID=U7Q1X0_SPOS1|nr:thiamine pyrophosphokinase [Sporothrix schenckii 1099-18]ERT01187.1 thiamine pyrophosphokinase [Sporothrix schenckii ATCC 58251]KJR88329.1 thiamine pyrophosphokinase [Sporothrix schenckii 1099-18]